ncbi:MAG: hypothetical protein ACJ76F_11185 [Bacteroidia bacterium]
MSSRLRYTFIVLLPFVFLVLVNSFSSAPTFAYRVDQCTRYCHNKGCRHFNDKLSAEKNSSWLSKKAFEFYSWNISALKKNFLGISYRDMNLLLYVVFLPLLLLLLTYTGFRKT